MVATALQQNLPGTSSASTAANADSTVQASTLDTLGTQPTASELQRISDLQQQFQQQAQQDPAGFRSAMRAAFGDKASPAAIDQLLDLALAGRLPMPSTIQFVETGSLGSGALGAYDTSNGGALYLDRSLLSDPEKLQSVFNEEMGHHLDTLLGGADAAGDEGAVFSRTLEQGPLSQSELAALKSENDHGFITVGGKTVAVEFRNEDEGSGNGQSPSPSPSPSPSYSGPRSSPGTGGSPTPSPSSVTGGGPPGTGGTPTPSGTNDRDDNTGGHQNGESESDKAGGTQGSNTGGDGTVGGDNGTTTGDDKQTQERSTSDTQASADTEPAPEPEPEPEKQGFWSRTLDKVQTGLDFAGFVPGLGAVPDLVNAGIHLARGNKTEAAISAAAAIPLGGDAFKAGTMGIRAVDKVGDARRASRVASDRGGSIDINQTGSYTNTYASGNTYSGKGTRARSQQSGRRQERTHDDPHVATDWSPASNDREAFKQESRRIEENGGVSSPDNYNKINSPGDRFRAEDGD